MARAGSLRCGTVALELIFDFEESVPEVKTPHEDEDELCRTI